ncbi:hypothetical protein CEXT_94251 [Caerostris extrusa]|uniref:Uncharacterized protein n=1 Tax=Caerostris extrusa TaxID=172846 RepID=A0AAV4NWI3_CAEEX|nr:hypothetical protein CEXT_94251 [Caerostris extrusa]
MRHPPPSSAFIVLDSGATKIRYPPLSLLLYSTLHLLIFLPFFFFLHPPQGLLHPSTPSSFYLPHSVTESVAHSFPKAVASDEVSISFFAVPSSPSSLLLLYPLKKKSFFHFLSTTPPTPFASRRQVICYRLSQILASIPCTCPSLPLLSSSSSPSLSAPVPFILF